MLPKQPLDTFVLVHCAPLRPKPPPPLAQGGVKSFLTLRSPRPSFFFPHFATSATGLPRGRAPSVEGANGHKSQGLQAPPCHLYHCSPLASRQPLHACADMPLPSFAVDPPPTYPRRWLDLARLPAVATDQSGPEAPLYMPHRHDAHAVRRCAPCDAALERHTAH